MSEINRNLICRVGVDLAKRVYQVHAVDGFEKVVMARSMTPDRFFEWCQSLLPGCMVAMESCSGAHHICRRLRPLGLDARILPGQLDNPSATSLSRRANVAQASAHLQRFKYKPGMKITCSN